MRNLRKQLCKIKKKRALTNEELWQFLGISHMTLKRYMKGSDARMTVVADMAAAAGMTIQEIIGVRESAQTEMFHQNLRNSRLNAGLSQRDLAALTGLSQVLISAYERRTCYPSLSTLSKLAKGLGMHLSDLIGGGILR